MLLSDQTATLERKVKDIRRRRVILTKKKEEKERQMLVSLIKKWSLTTSTV
jgi:hypothetical protein